MRSSDKSPQNEPPRDDHENNSRRDSEAELPDTRGAPRSVLRQLIARFRSQDLISILLRGAGAAMIIQGAGFLVRYALNVFVASSVGAAEFGSYSVSLSWAQLLGIVATLGMATAVIRFIPEYQTKEKWGHLRGLVKFSRRQTLLCGVAITIVGGLVVLVVEPRDIDPTALVLGMCLVPVLGLANLHEQMIRSMKRIALAYAPYYLLQPIIIISAAVALVWAQALSGAVVVLLEIIAYLAVILIQLVTLPIALPKEIRKAEPRYDAKTLNRVARPLLFVALSMMLLNRTGVLLVGLMLGDEAAGIYNAAATTARLVGFLLIGIGAIALPMISSLHAAGDHKQLQRLIILITMATLLISLPFGVGLQIGGRHVLGLFGEEFVAGHLPMVLLIVGQIFNAVASPVAALLNLTGHELRSMKVVGVSAILNIVLGVILIHFIGILGAAVATMTTTILWNAALSVLVYKHVKIRTFFYLIPLIGRRKGES